LLRFLFARSGGGSQVMNWFLAYIAIGWSIRLGMVPAVLRRNFAPGASIAWLGVVFLHPYIGLGLYLMFGEARLGPGRALHHNQLLERYALADPKPELPAEIAGSAQALIRLARNVGRMPVVLGNAVEFFTESAVVVNRLSADIEAAKSHVHLLYYIFAPDATGQQIAGALAKAAKRGVKCRVIIDQFASRSDFRRNGFASQLRASGVEVVAALPSSPLRRRDLRNHRKLAIIDDRIAYNGSQNLINADYGGRRGGPWVDLSGRFTGPVVAEFATVFVMDWAFETNQELDAPSPDTIGKIAGGVPMQVVPSGPVSPGESFRRLFLGVVESAQRQIIITTPYFIPDESSVLALLTATDRGVDVSLILPETSDNIFAAAAGRAQYARLLEAGVSIYLYRPGLIHAKTITVDDSVGIIGSANIDVRSFHLNFELTALLYGREVTNRLKIVQQTYLADTRRLERNEWATRPVLAKYADSAVSLISPLL
jgi:cardiolipin synthase